MAHRRAAGPAVLRQSSPPVAGGGGVLRVCIIPSAGPCKPAHSARRCVVRAKPEARTPRRRHVRPLAARPRRGAPTLPLRAAAPVGVIGGHPNGAPPTRRDRHPRHARRPSGRADRPGRPQRPPRGRAAGGGPRRAPPLAPVDPAAAASAAARQRRAWQTAATGGRGAGAGRRPTRAAAAGRGGTARPRRLPPAKRRRRAVAAAAPAARPTARRGTAGRNGTQTSIVAAAAPPRPPPRPPGGGTRRATASARLRKRPPLATPPPLGGPPPPPPPRRRGPADPPRALKDAHDRAGRLEGALHPILGDGAGLPHVGARKVVAVHIVGERRHAPGVEAPPRAGAPDAGGGGGVGRPRRGGGGGGGRGRRRRLHLHIVRGGDVGGEFAHDDPRRARLNAVRPKGGKHARTDDRHALAVREVVHRPDGALRRRAPVKGAEARPKRFDKGEDGDKDGDRLHVPRVLLAVGGDALNGDQLLPRQRHDDAAGNDGGGRRGAVGKHQVLDALGDVPAAEQLVVGKDRHARAREHRLDEPVEPRRDVELAVAGRRVEQRLVHIVGGRRVVGRLNVNAAIRNDRRKFIVADEGAHEPPQVGAQQLFRLKRRRKVRRVRLDELPHDV
ncbi:hypothetical protein BU14_0530s0009 [Porphyra umbilicalis]|uniref:Uncharacterized protein n=1 Tax=Porphyra umbilicalis TaxID=2786 RepID=A0A1X6NS64_PORUM|nr:hypothetical protein BU14_0530s0009 [Porphyra umbilicalis]|eukprot:OSX71469.1 hypothetical protein BU14_0530s0009 [Porphyra umbilicalis]